MTNVVLQGSRTEEYWVTHFSLEYSSDERGQIFKTVTDVNGNKNVSKILIAEQEFFFLFLSLLSADGSTF